MAYQNFCCFFSLRTGTLIIGWVYLIVKIAWLILLIGGFTFLRDNNPIQNEIVTDSPLVSDEKPGDEPVLIKTVDFQFKFLNGDDKGMSNSNEFFPDFKKINDAWSKIDEKSTPVVENVTKKIETDSPLTVTSTEKDVTSTEPQVIKFDILNPGGLFPKNENTDPGVENHDDDDLFHGLFFDDIGKHFDKIMEKSKELMNIDKKPGASSGEKTKKFDEIKKEAESISSEIMKNLGNPFGDIQKQIDEMEKNLDTNFNKMEPPFLPIFKAPKIIITNRKLGSPSVKSSEIFKNMPSLFGDIQKKIDEFDKQFDRDFNTMNQPFFPLFKSPDLIIKKIGSDGHSDKNSDSKSSEMSKESDNPLDILNKFFEDSSEQMEKALGLHDNKAPFPTLFKTPDLIIKTVKSDGSSDKKDKNFISPVDIKKEMDEMEKQFDKHFDDITKEFSSLFKGPSLIVKDDNVKDDKPAKITTLDDFIDSFKRSKRDVDDDFESNEEEIKNATNSPDFILEIVITSISLLTTLLLIVGAEKGSRKLLVPWILTISFIALLNLVRCFMIMINYFSNGNTYFLGANMLFIAVDLYIALIVYSHYKELTEQRMKIENNFFANLNKSWASTAAIIPITEKEKEEEIMREKQMIKEKECV